MSLLPNENPPIIRSQFITNHDETNGWFIPVLESMPHNHKTDKKGKVWSNRNYGADKKRQRKQTERQSIEGRIAQLENVLRDEHDMELEGG